MYTSSVYNETMSAGETLSSISEKSCISANNGGNNGLMTTANIGNEYNQGYMVS